MSDASINVGIPTCYSGDSLVTAITTIRQSCEKQVRILVEADRTPLTALQAAQLDDLNVEYAWNEVEGSQFKKLQQLVEKTHSEIFVFTQDDIVFSPDTLTHIKAAFKDDPNLTMVSVRVDPLPPRTWVEAGIAAMVKTVGRLARYWHNGDNYLSVSGRCMAFRTSMVKRMRFPQVVDGDAFFYFENMRLGGTYRFLSNAHVSIRVPHTLKEQIRPSSRFQYSKVELQRYFDFNLDQFYKVPLVSRVRASFETFVTHPYGGVMYAIVFLYTRLLVLKKEVAIKTLWTTESSTKL